MVKVLTLDREKVWYLMYVAIGLIALSLVAEAYAQPYSEEYKIDEEKAGELLDLAKEEGIPLAQDSISFMQALIHGIVGIFYPGEIPEHYSYIVTLIIATLVIVRIWQKASNHIAKVALIIIIGAAAIFLLLPILPLNG